MGHVILGAGLAVWCILSVPVAILGGIGGFFYGALPPDEPPAPPAYVEPNEAILKNILAKYPIQENLQSAFLKEARVQTSHTFVVSPKEGSQTSEGMLGQGMDTVLELSVERIWLKRVDDREGELNPPMVFVLFVRARLMRGTEKTVWYDPTFVHETHSYSYNVWPYYNRLEEAIEEAYQHLAEQMVEKLFYKTSN
jgi:hypothetical protein